MIKPVKSIGRNDKKIYICRLCGHVFVNNKKLVEHLNKSHLRNITKNDRKLLKLKKLYNAIKDKKPEELSNYEKYLLLKFKLNNIAK